MTSRTTGHVTPPAVAPVPARLGPVLHRRSAASTSTTTRSPIIGERAPPRRRIGAGGPSADVAGYPGCRAGDYARKHSPWTDFSTVPAAANQPLSAMSADYASLPTASFVIPNLCHDMHDCSIAQGDDWLRQNIDGYAEWARSHNSLLIVSFDESESNRDRDNHIATLAVGQRVPVGPITQHTDHYGLLRTLENLYGLPLLGHSAQAEAIAGLWRTNS
jgi:acid phosphatase